MLLIDETETTPDTAAAEAERMARIDRRRARLRDVGVIAGVVSILAGILFVVLLWPGGLLADDGDTGTLGHTSDASGGLAAAPTAAEAKGVKFEPFERVNPELPAIPAGAVKRFKVDVYEHVTKVSDELAPTEVWSYAINGVEHRGYGVSDPMVVEVGDKVRIDLINGSSTRMQVRMPHSIDFHSSEVSPGEAFKTISPGEEHSFEFVAKHPGVFMYHCATDPVLHHTGAGMVGAMIVKPKNLAPVDRELWITQQEFYIGKAGGQADMQKMQAKQPDVIAFNGYAAQYKKDPIAGEEGRAHPDVRDERGAFDLERLPRHRHRLRQDDGRGSGGQARPDDQPRSVSGRLGRVHARPRGRLPVRDPRLRRHGQGLGRSARDRARARRIDEALSSRMRTTSGALPSPLALSATIRSPRRLRSSPDATTTWVSAGFQRFGE